MRLDICRSLNFRLMGKLQYYFRPININLFFYGLFNFNIVMQIEKKHKIYIFNYFFNLENHVFNQYKNRIRPIFWIKSICYKK